MKYMKLGAVSTYIRGITFKPEDVVPVGTPGSIVCLRTKNVQRDVDWSDLLAVPKDFMRRAEQQVRQGDILISSANSWNLVGKCCRATDIPYSSAAGGFISILRAKPNLVLPAYLYWWLADERTQHEARYCARQTTNIANLNRVKFMKLPIPVPTLEEQSEVAARMDAMSAMRATHEKAASLCDDLLTATSRRSFPWRG